MPGLQRRNDEWDNFNVDNSDSETDSDGRVVRVNMGDASDDEDDVQVAAPVGPVPEAPRRRPARPAPAAPVIGPAPPAGFVRVDRGCPALDREGRDDRWCDAVETDPSQNAWGRLAERVANEFAGVLLWAKPVQPARSGDPSAGWRPAVLRLERVEPAGPTLTFAVEGAGFISQQKAAKHVAAASVAPLLDAALAAHRADDVATARQRARPLSILERLSQARGWPAPEPSGSDAVTWGPEGAVARAPRCAKGGGDKLQLAALVALRSLD